MKRFNLFDDALLVRVQAELDAREATEERVLTAALGLTPALSGVEGA